MRLPPSFTLFPYTTLFRSHLGGIGIGVEYMGGQIVIVAGPERQADIMEYRADTHRFVGSAGIFYPESAKADRKSTRLNSSHVRISYAVFCLKKKKKHTRYK